LLNLRIQSTFNDVLKRKVSHDPTFGGYQDDTDVNLNRGSNFKYNNKKFL